MKKHFPDCNTKFTPNSLHFHRDAHVSSIEDIKSMINADSVSWAIQNLKPYKTGGGDLIFPAILQKADQLITPFLVEMFRYSA
jgi:hypothetical protein